MYQKSVLIIDDDVLVRRALTTILQKKQQFRVYWMQDNFEDIEAVVREKEPNIVLLSVESLEGKGLDQLQRLKSTFKDLPVVVISPRNEMGAQAAITSLRLGAIEFITKPESKNQILFAERHLEKRLNPLLEAICQIDEYHEIDKEFLDLCTDPQKSFKDLELHSSEEIPVELAVMGGCTGGIQSLFEVVRNLPSDLSIPVIIAQHLPRTYTSYLATSLDDFSSVTVRELKDREQLSPGVVYIAPGGYQSEVSQSGVSITASVHRGPREHNMRPSIDVLFRSAAKATGANTMGVLLSGCGKDGLDGVREIKNQGGQVVVEDPKTAIAPALPLSAIMNGITKTYCSPEDIGRKITYYSKLKKSDQLVAK